MWPPVIACERDGRVTVAVACPYSTRVVDGASAVLRMAHRLLFRRRVNDDLPVTLSGRLLREGGMAILCEIDGQQVRIPRSQLLVGTIVQRVGDQGEIVIPRWLAINLQLVV